MAADSDGRPSADSRLEELHARLAGAVERLVTGEDWTRALEFAARFRSRSFGNTLLIWSQHRAAHLEGRVPTDVPTFVAGYRQWSTLGRQVGRGQRGYLIYAPVTARFASGTPDVEGSWRRLSRLDRTPPGESVRVRMVGVKPTHVWDVSQTDGPPIPQRPLPTLISGQAPAGLWEGLADLVDAEGFRLLRPANATELAGANGVTDYAERAVSVRADMAPAAQTKTLAHELAHVRLHGPDHADATSHRGMGEVEAESVALMIGAAHGMDTTGYTIRYVAGWATTVAGTDPVEVVRSTGERVRTAAAAILHALPTVQIGDGTPPLPSRTTGERHMHVPGRATPPPHTHPTGRSLR